MPLFFLVVGVALLVAAIRGTLSNKSGTGLFNLIEADFTTSNNFGIWILAIVLTGSLGYVPGLKGVSSGLLLLVVLVILLGNKGFFSQFQQAVTS